MSKITVELKEVLYAPYHNAWESMCQKYGINMWCLNEGRANPTDTIEVSLEDAERWGILTKRSLRLKNIKS